jgi:hypothetical protein
VDSRRLTREPGENPESWRRVSLTPFGTAGTGLRAAGRSFDDIAAIIGITPLMAHVYAHEDTEALQRQAIQAGTNPAILALA